MKLDPPGTKIAVNFTVNGSPISAIVEPRMHLADFLRESLRLTGTHIGCEHGVCGACTVLADGAPVRSCIAFLGSCEGLSITTIEGFAEDQEMKDLREAFSREHGLQCGFCTPGMLVTARDIVKRFPSADEKKIRVELSGNICRCTGYAGIVAAVRHVASKSGAIAPSSAHTKNDATSIALSEDLRFVPQNIGADGASASSEKHTPDAGQARPGWHQFEESFVIDKPLPEVWAAFGDLPLVASCLPGASLLEHSSSSVKGQITVGMGPISATFAGAAQIERDDATKTGRVSGGAQDAKSGSRTRGEIIYIVTSPDEGKTQVSIIASYNIQGMLAQFSRSSIVQEAGRLLINTFADNLNARMSGRELPAQSQAGGGSLSVLWLVKLIVGSAIKRLVSRFTG
jgi:aerobic carbon-monoxide dehydrogenase small subunit